MKERILKPKILFFLIVLFGITTFYQAQSRDVKKLNEGWQFTLAKEELDFINLTDTSWKSITIPHTWNNKDIQTARRVHYGTGWYKRELAVSDEDTDKQHFLKFEGVGQYAEVYINNRYVGEHLGSYSAFVFNITDFLKQDEPNTLLVKVNNELTESYPKDNFLFGIYGGIYRDVSIITTNDLHIALTDFASSGVYVHQEKVSSTNALLKIENLLKNESSEIKQISVRNKLVSENSKVVAENLIDTLLYPGGAVPIVSYLNVDNPRLWNAKKDPYLYQLKTEVLYDGEVYDEIDQTIGLRYFSIDHEKGFILNGEPYRLYGVCRHQEWEDMGNALLPKHHKKDMELINEVGATSIRLAHYQQAEYMYALADSIGFLIWAEIPFVNGYKLGADNNAKQQLTELIKQNFNHPSIFVWGMHNEVIKGRTVQRPVNLTKELHSLAKTLDPQRYTVAVSNIWWV
ncbi:MAG: sugar-binding domain-containing protein, partial [Bacteroidota bacterium]